MFIACVVKNMGKINTSRRSLLTAAVSGVVGVGAGVAAADRMENPTADSGMMMVNTRGGYRIEPLTTLHVEQRIGIATSGEKSNGKVPDNEIEWIESEDDTKFVLVKFNITDTVDHERKPPLSKWQAGTFNERYRPFQTHTEVKWYRIPSFPVDESAYPGSSTALCFEINADAESFKLLYDSPKEEGAVMHDAQAIWTWNLHVEEE